MGQTLFQSTHPHGVRLFLFCACILSQSKFQSTHPHGVRHNQQKAHKTNTCFNPRTHTGCDPTLLYVIVVFVSCFNPRTHTGCDCKTSFWSAGQKVSIHAPTRGATTTMDNKVFDFHVSIHAPTRGATSMILRTGICPIEFQSTHPHGVRLFVLESATYQDKVSIHAPTRGATILPRNLRSSIVCFNPRTHTGCDMFNSANIRTHFCFNPRTHTGCDGTP